ncbi:hypothetical protein ACFX13_036388 [Malus domestica]
MFEGLKPSSLKFTQPQTLSVSLSLLLEFEAQQPPTFSQSDFDELSPLRPPPHLTTSSPPPILSSLCVCGVSN